LFSLLSSFIIYFWSKSTTLVLAVGLSMFGAILVASPIALIVTKVVYFYREDPAIGSGPIATVITDVTSVVIYGFIATAILL